MRRSGDTATISHRYAPMVTSSARVVAVGCGWVTTHRHLPSIRRTPGLTLAGVVDRDLARAGAAGRAFGVPFAASLDDPSLGAFDAVSIGTSPMAHAATVREALALGKHVIVEKPFAMSVAEADALLVQAEAAGRCLAVVHNFQFARSVRAARAAVASGRFGPLRGVLGLQLSNPRRRLPPWYPSLPGGLFYDEAPHLFYLVRSFLGERAIAGAQFVPSADPADRTPRLALIRFAASEDEPFGSLQMSFAAALSEWQLIVLCERATLVCDIFRDILVTLADDGRHTPRQILGTSLRASAGHWSGVLRSGLGFTRGRLDYGNDEVFTRFSTAIATGVPPEGITGQDGRAVVAAMHAALASL